ncbi:MAG: hypothetical protein JOZ72_02080 [Alphaproteobacteria bacterium]|nr:hypothetical protein [Alphaproteobacteria bacterium]
MDHRSVQSERDALCNSFAPLIAQSYADLQSLSGLDSFFVEAGLDAIRIKKTRHGGLLFGEVFPHLATAGLSLSDHDRRRLAAAWIALYSYVCIVDAELDVAHHLGVKASLASSNLLAWGVSTLTRYTVGTPFESVMQDNINRAFLGQYRDLLLRPIANADRSESDIDKNRAIVATVAAYCAASGHNDLQLVAATEQLLGPFQALDDLQDVWQDYLEGNITRFVQIAKAELRHNELDSASKGYYRAIFRSPHFLVILHDMDRAISNAIGCLDPARDSALLRYFGFMSKGVAEVREASSRLHAGEAISEPDLELLVAKIANAS